MAAPWLQSVDGWAFLSENDDQLIFCRTAITRDMYLSLSQPIKHRKFIKILSSKVITNDRIFHLNVLVCNTVFCLRDALEEQERAMNLQSMTKSFKECVATQRILITRSLKKKFETPLKKGGGLT